MIGINLINTSSQNNVGSTPFVDTTEPSTVVDLVAGSIASSSVRLTASATDNIGVDSFDIYMDIASAGYNLIENVISTGLLDYQVTGLASSTVHDFKVKAKDAAGNVSVDFSNIANITTSAAGSLLFKPKLTNFRILESQRNRIYFDSLENLASGTTYAGFNIGDGTNETITGVSIATGATTGHYFTVSSSYDYFHNRTIRYSGSGSNITDANADVLYEMDLQYITNLIDLPTPTTVRYGSRLGSGTKDGTSEANAYDEAGIEANAASGVVIHVKAGGTFGSMSFSTNGTAANPIQIIGYKTTINDLDDVAYYWGGVAYTTSSLMVEADAPKTGAINITSDYIIMKNFQVSGGSECVSSANNIGVELNNFYTEDSSRTNIEFDTCLKARVSGGIMRNWDTHGFYSQSGEAMADGITYYADDPNGGADYYNHVAGKNNILRNLDLYKTHVDAGAQHGLTLKAVFAIDTEYNLVEDCTTTGVSFAIEARWGAVKNNVFRNIIMTRDPSIQSWGSAPHITIMSGASNNIFDRCVVNNGLAMVRFLATTEDTTATVGGNGNIFKNCIGNECLYSVYMTEDTYTDRVYQNNKIINSTFYNCRWLYYSTSNDASLNIFKNNIVNSCGTSGGYETGDAGFTDTYSNYNNNNFSMPAGTGNTSVAPNMTDAANGDYTLSGSTPSTVYDGGIDDADCNYDYLEVERKKGVNKTSVGAFEKDI